MSLKLQIHYSLSCTLSNAYLDNFIQLYHNNILMFVQKTQHMNNAHNTIRHTLDKPINSSYIHQWWTQMKNMMNINILMKNTITFWCSSGSTQQHFDGQKVHLDFQVKVSGAMTLGKRPLITLQRLYEPKNSIEIKGSTLLAPLQIIQEKTTL